MRLASPHESAVYFSLAPCRRQGVSGNNPVGIGELVYTSCYLRTDTKMPQAVYDLEEKTKEGGEGVNSLRDGEQGRGSREMSEENLIKGDGE